MKDVSDKLSASSRSHFVNPHEVIDWPCTLDVTDLCMSPELTSLFDTPAWDQLNEGQRRRLCFWEAINFFSLNVHGESSLLAGVAKRVNREEFATISEYLRHFIDEENKHSMWFAQFCNQYGGKVYPERSVAFPGEAEQSEEDFVFFAQVVIFEELVDRFNIEMAGDERLCRIVREINRLHHVDESRHLQFGRKLVVMLRDRWSSSWSEETTERVQQRLDKYVESTWRQFYNPAVYADAGIIDPVGVARQAWELRSEFRQGFTTELLV